MSRFTRRSVVGHSTLASVLPLAMAACGGAETEGAPQVKFGDPVSITFWHPQTGAIQRTLEEFVTKFVSTNGNNITLRAEFQGTPSQLHQKLLAAVKAGTPPDAAVATEDSAVDFARSNAVVDLAAYFEKGPSPFPKGSLDDLFPSLVSGGRYVVSGKKVLSLPFSKSLVVQYANEDALAKASGQPKLFGVSFENFRRAVTTLSRKDSRGTPQTYGHYVKRDGALLDAFILANGGELFTKDQTRVRFHEQPAVDVFEMWGELARASVVYTSEGFNYQSDFGQAKVLSLHDVSGNRPFLKDEVKNTFKWSGGLIPQKDPAKPVTVAAGACAVVFQTTPLKQASAWEWLKYFIDRDQTALWSVRTGSIPFRKSASEHKDIKEHWEREPQAKQVFDLIRHARPEPNLPAWPEIRELLQSALSYVVVGRASPRAVLEDAAKQANKLLEEKK